MNTKLSICTAARNGKTFLKDCYFTQPFRVANVSEDRRDPWLYLVIMSSSPGVLNLDRYEIDIRIEEYSKLQLQSQAYQRIFKMAASARIEQQIVLHRGSFLSYVPHPVVPHTGSDVSVHTTIHLEDGASLIFGEVLTCGRKLSGESFAFSSYRNCVEIFINNRLSLKDNVVLQPNLNGVSAVGQFEGYTHQAGFVYINSGEGISDDLIDEMLQISTHEKVSVGITRINRHCVMLRILGNSGELLYNLLKSLETCLRTGAVEAEENTPQPIPKTKIIE